MNILVKKAIIIDAASPYHGKKVDIKITNGKIVEISTDIAATDNSTVIKHKNLYVSQGWVDLHANIQDPGYEYKEDINTAQKAAAAGGFTRIAISPLSLPVRDSKSQIEYIVNQSKSSLVELLPYGCVSKNAEGVELAELHDMKQAGAIGFFDGKNSINNPNLLLRALEYCQSFNGFVIDFPHTRDIAYDGVMNEGEISTALGLKGIPELSEELRISRDISICAYRQGKLHFSTISTVGGLKQIEAAKKKKINISCDVSAAHLLLDDSYLEEFDSRFKTLPPFRTKATIKALIKGIKNGSIDAICSDHWPQDIESKKREFDHAAFGIINLQTAFSAANTALKDEMDITEIIPLISTKPASLLGLTAFPIKVGEMANLTLFDPTADFTFTKEMVLSKSKNSPFFKMQLKGKIHGVIHNNKAFIAKN